jgi:hypothetical protein
LPPKKTAKTNAAKQQEVEAQLAKLPTMGRTELQSLWQELFQRPPSAKLRREMLVPILAYRIQELAFGGLKESTLKRLHELARTTLETHANGKKSVIQPMVRPKVGTRYVREYNGKLHEVTVLDTGYEFEGQSYRSLTEIAKIITGTKWSGPTFFGYKRPTKRASL